MVSYRGFDIYIEQDHVTGGSPRDWEPMGTISSWDNEVANECPNRPEDEELSISQQDFRYDKDWWDARKAWYITNMKIVAILPLYGGYSNHHNYNTETGRQVGFVYMTREVFKNFSDEWIQEYHKGKSKGDIARHIMRGEIKTYNQWANGEVYGYRIEELHDSCSGFYGDDHEASELLGNAREIIDWEINKQTKHHCRRLKNMIKNKVELNKRIAYAYS